MFTGIIEHTGKITEISPLKGGLEITVASELVSTLEIDDSIAINGVCHTIVRKTDETFTIQSVEETLRKTAIGKLKEGVVINLEDSLTLEKKLDGHIVQGHVDTTGEVLSVENEGADWLIRIGFDSSFAHYLVPRGSIAVDGISLTIARLEMDNFTVAIIPYTWDHTNMNQYKKGTLVNLEFDVLGKYVLRAIETGFAAKPADS